MDTFDRAEMISKALLWLGGLFLFVWSWQVGGSFIAAIIFTLLGSLVLVFFVAPATLVVSLVVSALITLMRSGFRS